jgi:hypothetical protein
LKHLDGISVATGQEYTSAFHYVTTLYAGLDAPCGDGSDGDPLNECSVFSDILGEYCSTKLTSSSAHPFIVFDGHVSALTEMIVTIDSSGETDRHRNGASCLSR